MFDVPRYAGADTSALRCFFTSTMYSQGRRYVGPALAAQSGGKSEFVVGGSGRKALSTMRPPNGQSQRVRWASQGEGAGYRGREAKNV